MPSIKFMRMPQTDDELHAFVWTVWGIHIPRVSVCPNHSNPFAAFAEAYFARTPVSVWKASRGLGGKSQLLATLCATEAVTLGAHITILGGSAAQSQRVLEVQREAWEAPLAPAHLLESSTMYMTRLTHGAWIRSLTASQRSARGPHPQRLRLDEIDEMDLAILEAAQGQPMDREMLGKLVETQTVMSSTHQYPDKTMTEILKRAKLQGWSVHEWCVSGSTRVVSGDGIMPITQLREGMEVLTRVGYRKIQHVTSMGRKPTVTVTTVDGRSIICTEDHRIATGDGEWIEAGQLQPGQKVVVANVVTGRRGESSTWCCECGEVRSLRMQTEEPSQQMVRSVLEVDRASVTEHSAETIIGGSTCSSCGHEGWWIEAREACCGIDGRDGSDVHRAGTDRDIHRGLLDGRRSDDRGGIRLVAREVQQGARQSACAVAEEAGLQSDRPLASFSSSLVASVVPGDVIEVFDIGVEEAHEFVGNGIVVHNCYRESMGTPQHPGWLTQSMVDRKKAEIPKHMWDTEYDLQEPSITGRAIQTEFVDMMFDENLGVYPGAENTPLMFEQPERGAQYVTGVDWAKESDWTIISTWRVDCTPWRRVAWLRTGRKPWPSMIRDVERRLNLYGGRLIHDATGIGNVVDDFLTYDRMLVTPMIMAGRPRETMFNDYIAGIESEELIGPRIDYSYAEHKYVTWDDLYGSGHAPDSFVADALAWKVRNMRTPVVNPGLVTRPTRSPWREA